MYCNLLLLVSIYMMIDTATQRGAAGPYQGHPASAPLSLGVNDKRHVRTSAGGIFYLVVRRRMLSHLAQLKNKKH